MITKIRSGLYQNSYPWTMQGSGERHLVILDGLRVENSLPSGLALQGIRDALGPLADMRKVWTLGRRQGLPEGVTVGDLAIETAGVLRDLVPEPCVLWGMGTGGSLALEIAARQPGLIKALILISSGPKLSAAGEVLYRRLHAFATLGKWKSVHAALASVLFSSHAGSLLGGMVARLFAADLGMPSDPWDFLVTLQAELSWEGSHLPEKVPCPSLILHGESDKLYDAAVVASVWQGVNHAECEIWKHKPHGLFKVDRDAVTDRIRTFLSKVEQPRLCPLA